MAEFTFRRIDRFTARYTEADRVLTIEVEASFGPLGPSGLIVYLSAATCWDRPSVPLTDVDRQRVAANIRSLFTDSFEKLDLC